jgi:hypothetical protein
MNPSRLKIRFSRETFFKNEPIMLQTVRFACDILLPNDILSQHRTSVKYIQHNTQKHTHKYAHTHVGTPTSRIVSHDLTGSSANDLQNCGAPATLAHTCLPEWADKPTLETALSVSGTRKPYSGRPRQRHNKQAKSDKE